MRLTTDASRNVTSPNVPDPYGVVGSSSFSPFQWNGEAGYRKEEVMATGLSFAYTFVKVGARFYDPTTGCFLTRDTFLFQKPYTYCDGDPVDRVDPSGHIFGIDDPGLFIRLAITVYEQ